MREGVPLAAGMDRLAERQSQGVEANLIHYNTHMREGAPMAVGIGATGRFAESKIGPKHHHLTAVQRNSLNS